MMLADLGPTWGPIVAGAVALVVFVGLGFFIVKGHRRLVAAAERAQYARIRRRHDLT